MERTMVRNAALSAVLVAGLGMGGLSMAANSAHAAESAKADKAAAATSAKAEKAATSAKADAKAGALKDGEYTGEAKGMESTIKVTVTVKDGKIADLKADGQETQGIGSKALEQLPAKIVEANGVEGVDAISGASVTSKAIFTATEQALESAQGGAATTAASASKDKAASAAADKTAAKAASAKESK